MKLEGINYSAYEKTEKGIKHFCGKALYSHKGKKIKRNIKIVCPKCKKEGNDLKHLNWFEAKEEGQNLIINCVCGNSVNSDDLKKFNNWVRVGK